MAAKIKDGLFIGDAETSQSEVFINDNKISNLINLAGREVQNIWSSHGLVYLTYYWEDRPDYKLFVNHEDTILTDLVEFIDVSINHGISVLLFSRRGTGRCVIAACLYLMMKYRWGFEKTYDYVYSKKPDIELNKGFIQQMFALDMKLLAARQKAFAIRNGIDSGFKIEANMTIADIAAMLPANEAKRWNAWDTDYLLNDSGADDAEESKLERKGSFNSSSNDYKSDRFRRTASGRNFNNTLKFETQKPEDAAEELVLIYSFINSKNTINALPGPYRNVYDTPKHFKLKFDHILQEEDIHMFPTSPPRYPNIPRSILKGSTSHNVAQPKTKQSLQYAPTTGSQNQPQQSNVMYEDKQSLRVSSDNSINRKEQALLESIQPLYVINSRKAVSNGTGPTNASDGGLRRVGSAGSEDFDALYGINNQSQNKVRSSVDSTSDAKSTGPKRQSNDLYGFVGMSSDSNSRQVSDAKAVDINQPSAEERLRNLMADMQRQTYYKDGTEVTPSGHKNNINNATPNGPSLYDLANMSFHQASHVPSEPPNNSNYSDRYNQTRNSQGSNYNHNSNIPAAYDEDPLAAFEHLQQQNAQKISGGAVRARHDIIANPSSNPSYLNSGRGAPIIPNPPRQPVKTAWGATPEPNRPVNNSTNGRPLSASGPQRSPSPVNRQQSSNSSVASNSSGVSSITQQPPIQSVGGGASSSSRVYRHGSPAPNNRSSSSKPVVSSGYGSSGYSVGSSNSARSNARAPSPIGGISSSRDQGTPQRRLSNSSFTSMGSSGPTPTSQPDRKRQVGSSPLRASTSSNASNSTPISSGGGVTSKRYSTPTPQSQQHHEYDSGGPLSQSMRAPARSSTPTKNTWKF